MFNVLHKTVISFHRQLGDSFLYKSSAAIFLRNVSACSVIKLENVEKFHPTLQNYGFSDAQISKFAKIFLTIFLCDLHNNILPKLKFFLSIGVSSSDLPKVIAVNPAVLGGSLEKQLIPCYNFLKTLVDSDEDIVRTVKRGPRVFSCNLKVMVPNVELSAKAGVPQSCILYFLVHFHHSVQMKCDKFKMSVDEAIKMGFDPSRMVFIRAIHVLCEISKEGWENRMKVYRRFGLSDTEILSAFRSHPFCMKLSEEKITRGMESFVSKMGWSPVNVARTPISLFFNMERRIISRSRVIKILMKKGLLKESSTSISFLIITDELFLKRFVNKYKNNLPEIVDVYRYGRSYEPCLMHI